MTVALGGGDALLPVFHAAEVRWDEDDRGIIYSGNPYTEAEPITIRDGDVVTVGEASLEGDTPVDRDIPWVATPEPDCDGELWNVTSLVLGEQ